MCKCTRMQHVHVLVLLRKFKYSFNAKIWSILRTVAQFRTTSRYLPGGINKTTKNLGQHSQCSGQDGSQTPQKKDKCGRWNQITLLLSVNSDTSALLVSAVSVTAECKYTRALSWNLKIHFGLGVARKAGNHFTMPFRVM